MPDIEFAYGAPSRLDFNKSKHQNIKNILEYQVFN